VGNIDEKATKIIKDTKKALMKGIEAVRVGGHIGDIGTAVERVGKKRGYGTVRELGGHGVGHAVHEMPYIPNYGRPGHGQALKAGMVFAIEPMFNEGGDAIVLDSDGYTYRTKDGSRSAHFEHTIVVTKAGAEILTLTTV
jgi:methionyl aminopeptidase